VAFDVGADLGAVHLTGQLGMLVSLRLLQLLLLRKVRSRPRLPTPRPQYLLVCPEGLNCADVVLGRQGAASQARGRCVA